MAQAWPPDREPGRVRGPPGREGPAIGGRGQVALARQAAREAGGDVVGDEVGLGLEEAQPEGGSGAAEALGREDRRRRLIRARQSGPRQQEKLAKVACQSISPRSSRSLVGVGPFGGRRRPRAARRCRRSPGLLHSALGGQEIMQSGPLGTTRLLPAGRPATRFPPARRLARPGGSVPSRFPGLAPGPAPPAPQPRLSPSRPLAPLAAPFRRRPRRGRFCVRGLPRGQYPLAAHPVLAGGWQVHGGVGGVWAAPGWGRRGGIRPRRSWR